MSWYAEASEQVRQKTREKAMARYWRNRDAILAQQRAYKSARYRNDPDFRESAKATALNAYRSSSRPSKKFKDIKAWRAANPEKFREQRRRGTFTRRAKIRGARISPVNLRRVLEKANGLCGICRQPLGAKVDFDHIIPIALGGPHSEDNLQAAHPRCNRSKGTKIVN